MPVPLDDHARVVAAQDHHALRGPLQELLVDADPLIPVLLGDHLVPGHVVEMDEGQAGAVRGVAMLLHAGPA